MGGKFLFHDQLLFPKQCSCYIGNIFTNFLHHLQEFAFLYDHDDKSPDIDNSADKDLFTVEQESSLTREEFNDLMVEAGIDDEGFTPVKYQIRSSVEDLSQNTKRAIKRKYKQAMKAFSKTLTHTICPGQKLKI